MLSNSSYQIFHATDVNFFAKFTHEHAPGQACLNIAHLLDATHLYMSFPSYSPVLLMALVTDALDFRQR